MQQGSGLFSSGKQEAVLARARSLISPSSMEPLQSFACRKKLQKTKKNRLKHKIKSPELIPFRGEGEAHFSLCSDSSRKPFRCVFFFFLFFERLRWRCRVQRWRRRHGLPAQNVTSHLCRRRRSSDFVAFLSDVILTDSGVYS